MSRDTAHLFGAEKPSSLSTFQKDGLGFPSPGPTPNPGRLECSSLPSPGSLQEVKERAVGPRDSLVLSLSISQSLLP